MESQVNMSDIINDTDNICNREYFDKFKDILSCVLCKGFIYKPIECRECGTNYCKKCIDNCGKKGNCCVNNCSTPPCNSPTKATKCIIEKLEIKCQKCLKVIKYNNYPSHIETKCPSLYVQCPNDNCGENLLKKNCDEHKKTCPCAKQKCEECGSTVIRKNFSNKYKRENDYLKERILELEKKFLYCWIPKCKKEKCGSCGKCRKLRYETKDKQKICLECSKNHHKMITTKECPMKHKICPQTHCFFTDDCCCDICDKPFNVNHYYGDPHCKMAICDSCYECGPKLNNTPSVSNPKSNSNVSSNSNIPNSNATTTK